jgi:hypothetical protein
MNAGTELLIKIRGRIAARKYRVRIHAVRHMIEEGFTEENIVTAVAGKSRMIEDYPDESRCLVLGYFLLGDQVRSPLHVVCDYSGEELIDIVTAYIPQKPWWVSPTRRGRTA